MPSAVQFDTTAFREALRHADENLQRQAQVQIEATAAQTAVLIGSAYPLGPTGNLRGGLSWGRGTARAGGGVMYGTSGVLGAWVRSRAPHAWIYDHGTGPRQAYSRRSANRGRSPAHHLFISHVISARERLYADLASLLTQLGGSL